MNSHFVFKQLGFVMAWGLKSSSFLQWYSDTSGIIIDRMCCCSYLDAQVCGDSEAAYYRSRSTTVPTEWLHEDELEQVFSHTEYRDQEYETNKRYGLGDPTSSFDTVTTVPIMNTTSSYDSCAASQSDQNWIDSKLSLEISNDENNPRLAPKFDKAYTSPRRQTLSFHSKYVLRQVQQEGLANLPYLRVTGGSYQC